MEDKSSKQILLTAISVASVVALMISNIIATKQFVFLGITLPTAMLVFPITYITSDVISEVYGYRASRNVAWMGFISNLAMVLVFQAAIVLPFPEYFGAQEAFAMILGNTPRIFAASSLSYMVGDYVNDRVFKAMKAKDNEKRFELRAIISSMVGELFDAGMFIPLAFIGAMPIASMLLMIFWQWFFKIAYELITLPITSYVTRKVKHAEEKLQAK